MPKTAEQFRMKATECLELARQLDPADRIPLFKMAETWLRRAQAQLDLTKQQIEPSAK